MPMLWRMSSRLSVRTACFAIFFLAGHNLAVAQSQIRFAVVNLIGDERLEFTELLRSLAQSSSFDLQDKDLTLAASRGSGYAENLNLSRDEARAFGGSLGCDFYVIGKVLIAKRLARDDLFYFEGLAGLFLVDAHSGHLIKFIFERAKSDNEDAARGKLKDQIKGKWNLITEAALAVRDEHRIEIENIKRDSSSQVEIFGDGTEGKGIDRPFFYQRLKPVYTEEADISGITATVELEAVFGDDGRVRDVEVIRWAGFGLDESAISTVRMIKFKPAERDGKRLTIRGLVRYNFRRPSSQVALPEIAPKGVSPAVTEDSEKIKRSLRNIISPGQLPLQGSGKKSDSEPEPKPGRKPEQKQYPDKP